jgi:hypothetical protein
MDQPRLIRTTLRSPVTIGRAAHPTHTPHKDSAMSSSFFMTQCCSIINGLSLAFEPVQMQQNFIRYRREATAERSSQMQVTFCSNRIKDADDRALRVDIVMDYHPSMQDEVSVRFTNGAGDTIKFSKCCDYESILPSQIASFVQHCQRDFYVDGTSVRWQQYRQEREELKAATAK